ncbi:MAG: ABC transporter permease [Alphaproteobacteria bacterium]
MRTPLQIQKSIIFALLMRELKTRFGQGRLGYLWALIEPASHVIILSAMFMIIGKTMFFQVDIPLFIVTGIVPWLLFNNIMSRANTAIEANIGLFNYRHVTPMDALLTRILLEIMIYISSYFILLLICTYFGFDTAIEKPLELMLTWILFIVFCFAFSLNTCVLTNRFPEMKKILPIIIRPLYFISGVFFAAENIPPKFRDLLLLNPILHFIEFFRAHYFNTFDTNHASYIYLITITLLLLFFGLMNYRANHIKMVRT